ncbi:uncharacterized protein TNCV_1688101 [Trichonephila clavipes]|nr:uncharacterized protein TNCV_1688101 [Trichonephila clavipes]
MTTSINKSVRLTKTESVITVQRAFRIKFGCQPPNDNSILRALVEKWRQGNIKSYVFSSLQKQNLLLLCNECSGGYLSAHANTHNARIRSLENPHEVLESQRDSPILNAFCVISRQKVYGPFIFGEPSVTSSTYLGALQLCLIPKLEESEPDNFIWQQEVAPPHWHFSVHDWLNITVPDQWIAAKGLTIKVVSHGLHFHPI